MVNRGFKFWINVYQGRMGEKWSGACVTFYITESFAFHYLSLGKHRKVK